MPGSTSGYLLVADISGYTAFLSASELEHAQGTLTTLLELLIKHTRPPLIISRLAGDAVISYGLRDQFMQGQPFVEMLEDTYVAFRKAIELMVLNNTCQCQACANVGTLDLKFFVHYGEFGLQRLSAHDELVGSDVILLHRLLKNSVAEALGTRGYTLYTEAAVQHLGLQDMRGKMQPHTESYEHLGEVQTWVQDMRPVWSSSRASASDLLPPDKVAGKLEAVLEVPLPQVWDYVSRPEFRRIMTGADRQDIRNRIAGRVAPGSEYLCVHGNQAVTQTVLAWQPLELVTTEDVVQGGLRVLNEMRLEPAGNHTRLTRSMAISGGPWLTRMLAPLMLPVVLRMGERYLIAFKASVESDFKERGLAELAEPAVPPDEVRRAVAEGLAAPESDGHAH